MYAVNGNKNKKRYDTQCHINRLDLDWLIFLFLISNCLTVIEVLVNCGTEPGPACWEVCHCEGWSKSWCTYAIFFFQHQRMNCNCESTNSVLLLHFHSTKQYFMVKWRKAHHRLGTSFNMWAAAWQNQQNDLCAERRRRSAWDGSTNQQTYEWTNENTKTIYPLA